MSVEKLSLMGAVCAVVLSGCAAPIADETATTPGACEARWLQERGAVAPTGTENETGFEKAITDFFLSLTAAFGDPASADRRYTNCLSRVGVTDLNAFLDTDSDVARDLGVSAPPPQPYLAPKRPAHCPAGASVLYGGSGYCVGR